MMSTQQRLDIALQKAHFGDHEIAIRQLIEVIREQQQQINDTLAKENKKNILVKTTYSNETINGEWHVTDVDIHIGDYNSLVEKIYKEVKDKTYPTGDLVFPDVESVIAVLKSRGFISHSTATCWHRFKINGGNNG